MQNADAGFLGTVPRKAGRVVTLVFINIKKEVKPMDVTADLKECMNIKGNHVTVAMLGSDCHVFDWKQATKNNIKPPGSWHFKFSLCKRFYLKRLKVGTNVLIQGEPYYRSTSGSFRSVTKKRSGLHMMNPEVIEAGNGVNSEKLEDIQKLLEQDYGEG
jgi:hypothetical protein